MAAIQLGNPYQYSAKVCLLDVSMSKEGIHKSQIDGHTLQDLKTRITFNFQNTVFEYTQYYIMISIS